MTADPSGAFRFRVEERIECGVSHQVTYRSHTDNLLEVPIPLEHAINADAVAAYEAARADVERAGGKWDGDKVRAVVPLQACLDVLAAPTAVSDFFSTATGQRGTCRGGGHGQYAAREGWRTGAAPRLTPAEHTSSDALAAVVRTLQDRHSR